MKLTQITKDKALLGDSRSGVKRVVWFGTKPLPRTGLGSVIADELKAAAIPYYVVQPK